ncbi:GntR family transcriptional regulator [Arthrobacter sp. 31Y]|uniref:GntR family transcriptional regulator n=1 Tax=Arthrobacter sp. 31Y TaxID=1115632 RepID=UPI000466B34C|nr:GntR family transcriptional regulator [Arthrobacter sp. 31Y]
MTTVTDSKGPSLSAQQLVEILRRAIVSGELVPRQRLVEADLAVDYGASRGNVRVALTELSVEGLVERVQNRGARVRAVSMEEAIEITEVRGALEALCARKAAEKISDIEAEGLRTLAREMEETVARNDREAYSACNKRLHAKIIEISAQETAAATIRRLRGQAVRYQFQLARQPGRPSVSLPQHLAIIDAVCRQDPQGAAEAMRLHLESVAQAIRDSRP